MERVRHQRGWSCGFRVTAAEEVTRFRADLVQISLYAGRPDNIPRMQATIAACRRVGMPFVVHPVEYRLSEPESDEQLRMLQEVEVMAAAADLALIVHDESGAAGVRLTGKQDERYRRVVEKLSNVCLVAIENSGALDATAVKEFWTSHASSVTLDIGHLEAGGVDSESYVEGLEDALLAKVDFVHLHRHNGLRRGLRDHWGLTEGCRELGALRRLLERKKDVSVVLEVNESGDMEKSLLLVRALFADLKTRSPGSSF